MRWYCKIGDQQRGPLSTLELKWLAADGELRPTDLVRRDGDSSWTRAARVRGLFPSVEPASVGGRIEEAVLELASEKPSELVPSVARPLSATVTRHGENDPQVQKATSRSGTAGRKSKISIRDIVGLVALGLSAVLLVGAILFSFRGDSGDLPWDSMSGLVDTTSTRATLDRGSNPVATTANSGQVNVDADPSELSSPEAKTATPDDGMQQDGTDQHNEQAASPVAGLAEQPTSDLRLMPPSDFRDESDERVEPAGFQMDPDQLAEADGPFSDVPDSRAATPEPAEAAEDLIGEPDRLDPSGQAHWEKVQHLHAETRRLLSELQVAQDAVVQVRSAEQAVRATLNNIDMQLPGLTLELVNINMRLSGPPMPMAQRQALRNQERLLNQQITMLTQTRMVNQRQLEVQLPPKLLQAERTVAAAVQKYDATIPAWIELADPYGVQSQVAHQKVADACTAWLVGQSMFLPAVVMRGFAFWHVGSVDRALEDFDQVVRQSDGTTNTANRRELLAVTLSARSVLYAGRKQEAQAKADYTKASEILPRSLLVCVFRGRANALLGRTRAALDDFRRATQLDNKHPVAYREAAWLLASSPGIQDGRRAVDLGRIACELTDWNQWQCLDAFALANAADGNFELAIQKGRKARDMAPRNVRPEIEQRLELYQAGVVPQNVIHR